jgi:hypothetical protein
MNAERINYASKSFDCVISADFFHHARYPSRCLKEMSRVARFKLCIADLNVRGMSIMDKIHQREGKKHSVSKISMKRIKEFLEDKKWKVKTYKTACHNIVVGVKGIER